MLKRVIKRALIGFVLGMIVGNGIALLSTMSLDRIVSNELIEMAGSKTLAIVIQTILGGLIGAAGFGGMLLYEIESWSMIRTMSVHFTLIMLVFIPVCIILHWVGSIWEMLILAGFMLLGYMIVWLIMFCIYKAQVKELNTMQGRILDSREEADNNINNNGGASNEN
ncbi:MAG: DUF3021 domain-containing protein [Ruminococcus sp.]|nr:DUF3021 domain-containing protein [Ruminococcus sp.]